MLAQINGQEIAALEYLVSSACDFLVELREAPPENYYFRPANHFSATALGDYERGQRFWNGHSVESYDSPLEAAVMFVNAVRNWEQRRRTLEQQAGEPVH